MMCKCNELFCLIAFIVLYSSLSICATEEESYNRTKSCSSNFMVAQTLTFLETEHTYLKETLKEQSAKIRDLERKLTGCLTPQVAFTAQLSSDLSVTQGTTIVFDNVLENTGNGYDEYHGVFTAMHDGIYFFEANIAGQGTGHAWLIKNNVNYDYTFISGAGWKKGTLSAALQLVQGDRVWIQGNQGIAGSSAYTWPTAPRKCYHSSFKGMLVSVS